MDDFNDFYVKLPNDIYDNVNITNEELMVLTLLYRNYIHYKNISICSIQMILDYMKYDTGKNHKIITIVKDAIKGLMDKKYICNLYDIYYNEITSDNLIPNKFSLFYIELIPPPDDNYFKVYDKDINLILDYIEGTKTSKFNIIRYFIACKRVSNNSSNFGYLTQGKLKKLVNDSRTIQKYNKILQDDLHLIRYCNDYLTKEKHYCTTFIGKYDDENNFNNQVQAEIDVQGLIHTDKVISNKKRSYKQKINKIEDNIEKDVRIKELEEQLEKYKNEYDKLQYKESKKKEVKYFGEPEPKQFNDEDEEDMREIDLIALLDEM